MARKQILTPEQALAKIQARCEFTENRCWIWKGSRNELGYGGTYVNGKRWMVHRFTFNLFKGDIPKGMYVCHTCDNPPCCNPAHLWLGTHTDNQRDMVRKGRHVKQTTHCKHGHAFAEHGAVFQGRRKCMLCSRIRQRRYAGWPEHLAVKLPATPKGHRPVYGCFHRTKKRLRPTVNEGRS